MTDVPQVADWVAAQLHMVEQRPPEAISQLLDRMVEGPGADIVRLGDNQVLIHAPKGRSFELTVREITGEVDR